MAWKTSVICARCYEKQYPGKIPVRYLATTEVERCYLCKSETSDGIYVRTNVEE